MSFSRIPQQNVPLLDSTGLVSVPWYRFLQSVNDELVSTSPDDAMLLALISGTGGVTGTNGSGGGGQSSLGDQFFVATANQTVFTTTFPLTNPWVFRGGVKQQNAIDFTVLGSSVTFAAPLVAGDVVEIVSGVTSTNDAYITATAAQTTFTPGWAVSNPWVFRNGIKQQGGGVDFNFNVNSVVFVSGLVAGDLVEIVIAPSVVGANDQFFTGVAAQTVFRPAFTMTNPWVFRNGQKQAPGTSGDYTFTSANVTFNLAVLAGDTVEILQ